MYEQPSISRSTITSRKSTGSCASASRTSLTACCCNISASGSSDSSARTSTALFNGTMSAAALVRRDRRLYHALRTIANSHARASSSRSEGKKRIARTQAS
ncbi:MAG: hypothetical protein AUI11_08420 [Acidobacteria bacterium 13_2_20CM_2_66_4]|nr:MAG: hypothetical protein AUI11_08420 [Acidobacteria bacterium 13_2_20CM_2_66_4]